VLGFIARRVVNYAVLASIATVLGYVLASATLNPSARYLGRNPPIPEASINSILNELNINPDTPILERLGIWLTGLITQGSLGLSVTGNEVTADIVSRAGTSLRLLIVGSILGAVIGVALGVWGAVRQYRASDQIITYSSFAVLATPPFVVAVLLMIGATNMNRASGTQIINFTGEYTAGLEGGFWEIAADRFGHLALPTISLTIGAVALYSRYQRSAMLDVLSADYIRTARSKGRRRGAAIVRHGVRVALIPMSTFFAYSFGTILTGATITENVFSWHGMGEYLLQSVTSADINAVAGTILFTSILVLIAGTLSDVVYAALDPRVRV
jgi:peptide/nickel transport system permease protein